MLAMSVCLPRECCPLLLISLVFWAALAPTASAFPLANSNPLYQFGGQVRLCHLYTADEQTHLFLEIKLDGKVGGSRHQNPFSLLEIKAVKSGIVRIQAKKTSQFLCMKPNGQLYGSLVYLGEACNFRETVLQDGYNLYYSELHNLPLSLSSTGTLSRSRQLPPFSQFLPIRNRIPVEPAFVDYNFYEQELDVESADPLGMMDQNRGFISPSYVF
ncbi:fibroblast growth factor 21 isoform X2 [Hemicordylus capensis]|uniref:fibroblast growth factor 21 isoform X2 n=1 Tax=Hemicordylus capensis TaxID=884348 RepID=UPI0023027212|nr:fibroblast growth factor 21 isoform X2 [Hemicordylus capensis]